MALVGELVGRMLDLCVAHLAEQHSPGAFHPPGSLGEGQWQTQCSSSPPVMAQTYKEPPGSQPYLPEGQGAGGGWCRAGLP